MRESRRPADVAARRRASRIETTRRFRTHLYRFQLLASDLERGAIHSERLTEIERRDNIFPELDYRHFGTDDARG